MASNGITSGLRIIDVDSHWCETPDLWVSRAPAKYRDRVPHMTTIEGRNAWFVNGDIPFGGPPICVINHEGVKNNVVGEARSGMMTLQTLEECMPAAYQVKERLAYMDRHRIWAELIYPNIAGFSAAKFMLTFRDDPELEYECIKIYNDWAAEVQQESGHRLFPLALFPFRNMTATVREMRRCHEELKAIGFVISDNLTALGLPDYTHPYWTPMFEYVDSIGGNINFHTGGTLLDASRAVWKHYTDAEKMALNTTGANVSNAAAMANVLMSGLHDRYPNIRWVSIESGIGWIPSLLEMLDHNLKTMVPWQKRRTQRLPSEYFRDHWWATFWFEECAIENQLKHIGVDKVMFETDFPHPTCLYPDNLGFVERVLGHLDPRSVRRMLQDNAVEVYRLPLPAEASEPETRL